MITKSAIAAMVLVTVGLSSPAFAQVPGEYYGYPGAYAYPYGPPAPIGAYYDYGGLAPYGYGYGYGAWGPNSPLSIYNNIHTPPNH